MAIPAVEPLKDALEVLERPDKHYLGCGGAIIFAPRFPAWLDIPGFWDEIDVHHYSLPRLFTVTFLEREGDTSGGPHSTLRPRANSHAAIGPRPLSLRQTDRRWTPAELVARYQLDAGLSGREHRSVVAGGKFLSEWTLHNATDDERSLVAVVWTAQESESLETAAVRAGPGYVTFSRTLVDRRGQLLKVTVSLEAGAGQPEAGCAFLSETTSLDPRWELTPFSEKWRRGLATRVQLGEGGPAGALYLAAASRFTVPGDGRARLGLRARVEAEIGGASSPAQIGKRAKRRAPIPNTPAPSPPPEPGEASREGWRAYFAAAPQLQCSDPYFERYWYYRWYGLRLCGHEGGVGHHRFPGCCEGTGYFHVPIAYSAQCHARELRWLPDPERARGVILNFLSQPKANGQLHGRIYVNHLEGTDFYFADWGGAVLAVDQVHPDAEFLRAVYPALVGYNEWLKRERDAEGSGLIDVIDQYETGQEYMSRYLAVSPEADSERWENRIRLKGVDATVYSYQLQRALARIAERLKEPGDAARWTAAAERTGAAVRERMWDAKSGMFSDVDPHDSARTGVKAAVCFYPYATDIVTIDQIPGLKRHLLNPSEFWTEYPVPSTSADDPYFSPDAEWKGKRHNCPWNGRVWPMANSHVAEAIARAAIEHDEGLRGVAAEFIRRFIRMMFHDGDPARPNCYEHYNPETGTPSLYRGFDDYQHSWVNDLIVKYVAGLRPDEGDAFIIDPLPFGLGSLRLAGLPYRGRRVDIEIEGDSVRVWVGGTLRAETRIGEPRHLEL